jgi:hypothetical protein
MIQMDQLALGLLLDASGSIGGHMAMREVWCTVPVACFAGKPRVSSGHELQSQQLRPVSGTNPTICCDKFC